MLKSAPQSSNSILISGGNSIKLEQLEHVENAKQHHGL